VTRTSPAAYGVRLAGAPDDSWLQVTGAEHWPVLQLQLDAAGLDGSAPVVEVDPLRAVFPRSDMDLVHPGLAHVGLQLAVEWGWDALHAGALVAAGGGAWAVVGTKETGKSTLVAACALAGISVLTDDVLVIRDGRCLAGPRSVDLRPSAGRHLAVTELARTDRHRLALPPVAAEQPLAGLVHLTWADELELRPMASGDSLARLLQRQSADRFPRAPDTVFDLASRPAFELRRPRDWDQLEATVALLRSRVID
jgi:hypothetical protein